MSPRLLGRRLGGLTELSLDVGSLNVLIGPQRGHGGPLARLSIVVVVIAVAACAAGPAAPPPKLLELRGIYETSLQKLIAKRAEDLEALQGRYLHALGNSEKEYIKAGNLDGALATQTEIAWLKKEQAERTRSDAPLPGNLPTNLKKLRGIYHRSLAELSSQHDGRCAALRKRYVRELRKAEVAYTKSGDLESALAVRNEAKAIGESKDTVFVPVFEDRAAPGEAEREEVRQAEVPRGAEDLIDAVRRLGRGNMTGFKVEEDGLLMGASKRGRSVFPVLPQRDYDLYLAYTIKSGGQVMVMLPFFPGESLVSWKGDRFNLSRNADAPPLKTCVPLGSKKNDFDLLIKVRSPNKESISVTVENDGRTVLEWEGKRSDLPTGGEWVPAEDTLGLTNWYTSAKIIRAALVCARTKRVR